jgi:hypothetical protein
MMAIPAGRISLGYYRPMPKSRSKRVTRQPPAKPKPKQSPRWVGALFFGLMAVGVAVIIVYYLRGADPSYGLWIGLGLISASFVVATQWH